jgi:hypothetical protein
MIASWVKAEARSESNAREANARHAAYEEESARVARVEKKELESEERRLAWIASTEHQAMLARIKAAYKA